MHLELIIIIIIFLAYISYMLWSIREDIAVLAIRSFVKDSEKEK